MCEILERNRMIEVAVYILILLQLSLASNKWPPAISYES
jgi:hypothetical protein